MTKVITDEVMLKNSINYLLPASEIVARDIQEAYRITKKYLGGIKRHYNKEDTVYLHSLRVALNVAKFCKEHSPNDTFFNFKPIIVAILHDTIEDTDPTKLNELMKELEVFRSDDNYVKKGIEALTNVKKDMQNCGRSNYMIMKFSQLFRGNQDYFMIKLFDRIDNLTGLAEIENSLEYQDNPFTSKQWKERYLLESLAIHMNILNSGQTTHVSVRPIYNQFRTLINQYTF